MRPKIIAFYLPQFHPTPDNNKWWGKGFTEWTNVGKAKPLFRGHYQPKIPADLGYYDLRLPEVRELQVELAKKAGIYAFCYWHYWLGGGRRLLEMPFNEVLRTGKPNFPFCLGWANHNWEKKQWNNDITCKNNKILIKQEYPGEQDYIDHFNYALNAFNDSRYVKIENKPFFLVYDPHSLPEPKHFIEMWNCLARKNGFDGVFFVAHTRETEDLNHFKNMGFDSINFSPHRIPFKQKNNNIRKLIRKVNKKPLIVNYIDAIKVFDNPLNCNEFVIPTIIPNWDHTPRSNSNGIVLFDTKPEYFEVHVKNVLKSISNKKKSMKIVMLKSWNEWGEGNYMEPDLKYGTAFIESLAKVLKMYQVS